MKDNQTEIVLDNGKSVAKLGGRYCYDSSRGGRKYLKLFYVDTDVEHTTEDPKVKVLTPTREWAHELGDGPFQRDEKEGVQADILSKDIWDDIAKADEIEVFDPEKRAFVNKEGEITDYLPEEDNRREERTI